MDLLDGLNANQRRVAEHTTGPCLVVAGAGTGKTEALTRRIAKLMERGIDPARILAVTFSREGSEAMTARLRRYAHGAPVRVGTFHSFALQVLRTEGLVPEDVKIQDSLRPLLKLAAGWGPGNLDWKVADPSYLEEFVSFAKVSLLRPEDPATLALAGSWAQRHRNAPHTVPAMVVKAYARAEELRRERGILTFDDYVSTVVYAFRADPNMLRRWAERYGFVLQDEAQDQGLDQLTLAAMLAEGHRNYMIVGDPGQSIYSWRGAQPSRLLAFAKEWNAEVIPLEENYRSGASILERANALVTKMPPHERVDLQLQPTRGIRGTVEVRAYMDFDAEASALIERFQRYSADGTAFRAMAVLYRTSAQSRALEEAALAAGVPYQIAGSVTFYERREVSTLLSYLRLCTGTGTIDDVTATLSSPARYLGETYRNAVAAQAVDDEVYESATASVWFTTAMRATTRPGVKIHQGQRSAVVAWGTLLVQGSKGASRLSTVEILDAIVSGTEYIAWLEKSEGRETTENSRVSNVRELIRTAARFHKPEEFLAYVDDVVERAKFARASKQRLDAVTLSTLHRAKGLEWDIVALVGVNAAILPHARGVYSEELRLFYVGTTRARNRLLVSYVQRAVVNGRERVLDPSEFLRSGGFPEALTGDEVAVPEDGDPGDDGSDGEDAAEEEEFGDE